MLSVLERIRRARWGGLWMVLVLLVAPLALSGCGVGAEKVPETRYFVVDYSVPTSINAGPIVPVVVGVDNFRSDAVYRTEKIVFRKVPYEVNFYPYERWGARPDEIVTDRMIDHLLATKRFREVVRAASGVPSDYLVRGRVKRFEEDGISNKYFADAQIEISLIYRRTGQVLLQRRLSRREVAASKPPGGFVDAMARNLKGLLGQAAAQIGQAVSKHQRQMAKRP
ncbi:MAG: hypothetical protein HOC91_03270 [Nitrospinaceae bacterium]|jgi:cholesterol transport system auxiliary component|nr:hypothetical protein [Nitrospinaceae bacterium]MBT4094027.1 hypothetical protein [Nitrospinaceae bacterium]MBT4429514.1 hypothetical protein [Nitrospinaceae bacterium]MBT5369105.1 hypothetical protein [Nitrospinaceae bacterium]MBT5947485.1 hypothetical protein [Nitrospinaceae bacterium]